MFIFAFRSGLVLVAAMLWLGGESACAQSAPIRYSSPGWLRLCRNLNAGQGSSTDGNVANLAGTGAGGSFTTRYNFANGWFAGSERGAIGLGSGLGMSSISQAGAFGSLETQGVQFGYNFRNAPVTF